MYKNILVITDNEPLYKEFRNIIKDKQLECKNFNFAFSYNNKYLCEVYRDNDEFIPINIKESPSEIINKYDLIISLHCKQIFPPEIVKSTDCVNIHPGFNPYNRGWYPQVFSILNKMPCGVTIHLIDENLDHGDIIVQEEIEIKEWDTSETVYNKIIELEIKLLNENIEKIINKDYKVVRPSLEGNVNLKKDFNELCEIDLDESGTARDFIDRLRALSFSKYNNAYFITKEGEKVWVNIKLTLDNDENI